MTDQSLSDRDAAMDQQPTPTDQAVIVIDELPPDRHTNAPNGAPVYEVRGNRWLVAQDGLLEPGEPPAPTSHHMPTPKPPARRRWLMVVATAPLVVAILGFGAYLALGRDSGPSLTAAEKACNDGRTDARIDDDGKTLIINSSGDPIKSIVDTQTVGCVLDFLKTPAAVRSHIDSTRALDGRQTDSWDGFKAAWTYHPDDGLDITIEQK